MDPKCSIFSLVILAFFLLFSHANAFNITGLLGHYPEFSNFSRLLNETDLVREINSRQTITVLAVENSKISGIMGKPDDVLRRIMMLHVILDYYDPPKLDNLSKKSTLLTTLFQSTGQSIGRLGFLNVTKISDHFIAFGSAVRGSPLDSKLVRLVASQPYSISVLQISAPIDPESIETLRLPNKTSAAAPAHAPKAHKGHKGPSKDPVESPVEAPAPSDDEAEGPSAEAPTGDAPAPSDTPAASPPALISETPNAESPSELNGSTGEGKTVHSLAGAIVIGVATWFAM